MKHSGTPDTLVVINGPEDGTEFPIVRAPFHVGQDPSCGANVRLDTNVQPFHALVTAVSDGYRVRRVTGSAVYVDGRRAGIVRSRILRPGGVLQVGGTLLTLDCAPDGLASRSHGMAHESDTVWLLRCIGRKLLHGAGAVIRFFFGVLERLLRSPLFVIGGLVMIYLLVPSVNAFVNALASKAYLAVVQGIVQAFS